MNRLYIIDASNYLFRAYYAIRGMSNPKGLATNALFGFVRSIEKLKKDVSPEHLVCVFDGPNNKHSRTKLYPDYKGHRAEIPEDLPHQINLAKVFCEVSKTPFVEVPDVEADDAMGSIAKWAEEKGCEVFLCSSDKDLCQLVSEKVKVLQTHKDNLIIDSKGVVEKFGVLPEQIIDYLAIMGDSSDNIPGIPGFGPKTASELLGKHQTLQNILDNPDILEKKSRIEKVKKERDSAIISRKLATIDTGLKIPEKEDFYQLPSDISDELVTFYEEMNFRALLKGVTEGRVPPKISTPKIVQTKYTVVDDEKSLTNLIKQLAEAKEVSLNLETTSLDKMLGEIVGFGLTDRETSAWYIPLNGALGVEKALKLLKPFLETYQRFFGHNIKYDMHILANHDIWIGGISFDTMLASYLLNSNLNRHNLDDLVLEHFDHKMTPLSDLVGKKKKDEPSNISEVEVGKVSNYCGENVDYTFRLRKSFLPRLKERNLLPLLEQVEMPLVPVLFKMERHGILADKDELSSLSKEFHKKLEKIQETIFKMADQEFNLNSPKQLSEVLFENLKIRIAGKKTKSGYSTGAEVLEALKEDHPIIPLILEYRTLEKLRSTYIDSLPLEINSETGRIHCSFNQSVTATGRLSSKGPNLQNIPIRTEDGRKIRKAFKPEKMGWSFLSLDYSQIELRILAHLSGDENLISAFINNEDVHVVTASQVFDLPLKEVTKEMRFKAKAVNFGILYGQQAFGLSRELGIDIRDARDFIERYFEQYPKVKEFLESCKTEAIDTGAVKTLLGRERLLPDANSKNHMVKAQALRFAVNTPIQGTQADIIKMAMVKIDKLLFDKPELGYMILQIHDELIFECPDKGLPTLEKEVKAIMEGIIQLKVPLKVDISVGKNWGDC